MPYIFENIKYALVNLGAKGLRLRENEENTDMFEEESEDLQEVCLEE